MGLKHYFKLACIGSYAKIWSPSVLKSTNNSRQSDFELETLWSQSITVPRVIYSANNFMGLQTIDLHSSLKKNGKQNLTKSTNKNFLSRQNIW